MPISFRAAFPRAIPNKPNKPNINPYGEMLAMLAMLAILASGSRPRVSFALPVELLPDRFMDEVGGLEPTVGHGYEKPQDGLSLLLLDPDGGRHVPPLPQSRPSSFLEASLSLQRITPV